MRLFGFTRDKKLLHIDLNFEQFALSGIHPSRIDLFEPNPIELPSGEHDLQFTPLRELAFAFRSTDGNVYLAVHDGEKKYCVTGELHVEPVYLVVRNFTVLERSFEDCVREYMEILHTAAELPDPFLKPQPCANVLMQGNELRVRYSLMFMERALMANVEPVMRPYVSIHPRYEGVMFEEQQLEVELPPEIRWVVEEFSQHRPFVWGAALRKVITQQPVKRIDVKVEQRDQFLAAVHQRFGCSARKDFDDPSIMTFKINDVRYNVGNSESRFSPMISIDGLYCTDVKGLCGLRITFSDVFSKQARFLSRCDSDQGVLRKQRAQLKYRLQRAGFEFFDFPTLPCD